MRSVDSFEKTLILGKIKGRRRRGWQRMRWLDGITGWMASLTEWTWVWVSSGSWWWTEMPGVLQSMGLQRVRYDWATELNWKVMVARTKKKKVLPAISVNKGCCLLFWYTSDASSQAISHCSHLTVHLAGHSRWRKQGPEPRQLTCMSEE